ncbi:MAG: hypothetical protein EAZ07_06835 [Cytophagales bacterium]|nr:MAG: hypothetical protein EAZ07_06835 [Cytophagales bacterium]
MSKYHKIVLWALLLGHGLSILKISFPILSFQLNYDLIVKEYCINKNKPSLRCNGKCYLTKKIAQTEDKNPTKKIIHQIDFIVDFFLSPFFIFKEMERPLLYQLIFFYQITFYQLIPIDSVFPPPQIDILVNH